MSRKDELFRAEEEAWSEIHGLVHALTPDQGEEAYSEDWTVKDLLAHLSCWTAEAAQMLCQIRLGTYEGWDEDEDEVNRRFHEATRDLDHDSVMAQLHAARARMREELGLLPRLDDEAISWFTESGSDHYREHLPRLRALFPELGAPAE